MLAQEIEDAIRNVNSGAHASRFENALLINLYMHIVKLQVEVTTEALKPFELNHVAFRALMMLRGCGEEEEQNPSLMAERTGESRANMTRITDQLVERGLIARAPSATDRRRLVLTMTPAGEALVEQILPALMQRMGPAYSVFNPDEKQMLITLLKKQLDAIEAIR